MIDRLFSNTESSDRKGIIITRESFEEGINNNIVRAAVLCPRLYSMMTSPTVERMTDTLFYSERECGYEKYSVDQIAYYVFAQVCTLTMLHYISGRDQFSLLRLLAEMLKNGEMKKIWSVAQQLHFYEFDSPDILIDEVAGRTTRRKRYLALRRSGFSMLGAITLSRCGGSQLLGIFREKGMKQIRPVVERLISGRVDRIPAQWGSYVDRNSIIPDEQRVVLLCVNLDPKGIRDFYGFLLNERGYLSDENLPMVDMILNRVDSGEREIYLVFAFWYLLASTESIYTEFPKMEDYAERFFNGLRDENYKSISEILVVLFISAFVIF